MVGDARLAHKTTLAVVLLRYHDQCSPNKRGAQSERARLSAMARHPIGACTLAKLSSSMVATYRDARLQEVAPATVVRELSLMQTALTTATREWDIPLPCNPVSLVRRPAVRNDRKRRLGEGEEERLLCAAKARRSDCFVPLIVMAIETGMRRSELLALTWEDIGLRARVAHVRHRRTASPVRCRSRWEPSKFLNSWREIEARVTVPSRLVTGLCFRSLRRLFVLLSSAFDVEPARLTCDFTIFGGKGWLVSSNVGST
jgi:integrase